MNKKCGRPKGYSPGPRRVITHRVGEWSWNTDNLHKRLIKDPDDPYACWLWQGSKNTHGNIFGAFKNDKAQMTQANRLLAMEQLNRSVDEFSIHMRCGNHHCSNPDHFELKPNNRYKKPKPPMMLIEETLHTEGTNPSMKKLTACLKEFHSESPFESGIDWGVQTMWAKLTQEQCVMFCLKYPEYVGRFRQC